MAATATVGAAASPIAGKSTKQVQALMEGLNVMRNEQRQMSSKLNDIEADLNEHRLVLDALRAVDSERKCFRMVGGVLIEQKVKDVIPGLEKNYDLINKTIETYQSKIQEKGTQISEYVKTNNLVGLLRSASDGAGKASGGDAGKSTDGQVAGTSSKTAATSSVLV